MKINLKNMMLSATVAIALTACGGGGGSTSATEDSGNTGGNNGGETNSYYGAYVPLSLDNEGKISGDYFCSEETQGDTMYKVNTSYSLEECNATLQKFVADFNHHDTPATANQQEGLDYINDIRRGTGLPIFHGNSALERGAKNHELYVADVKDTYNVNTMHYEYESEYPSDYYTGYLPSDRAFYEGYTGHWASDVVTWGNDISAKESLGKLMPAIYHRRALLWNNVHEIGMGGTSNDQFNFKFQAHLIGGNWLHEFYLKKVSAKLVAYPYDNQQEVGRVFYNNESPDPLPDNNDYVGNPISVFFNSDKAGEITMVSFKLFYDETDVEVTDTTLMDKNTDPNGIFTSYDFALFPMDILDGATTYRVEFEYIEDGVDKSKVWRFTTRP